MGKQLVLTEKPSVAADFAKGVGGLSRKDGYFEGDETIVTYAFGHLLELAQPSDYDPAYKTWNLDDLPIIPETFDYKPIASSKDQLKKIKGLLERQDVTDVILATDAGREGELIGRLVLNWSGWKDWGAVRRFWVSEALTPPVVQKGLAALRDSSTMVGLYESGKYRQHADWLVGINFSRLYSLRLGGRFSFGRVQTAVLGLIVRRDRDISGFTAVPFWEIVGLFAKDGQEFKAKLKQDETTKFDSQDRAKTIVDGLANVKDGSVAEAVREEKQRKPPRLLNLTALQRLANNKFGFSADKTLKLAQKLYEERKVLSYPRTPSRVLGGSDTALVKDLKESLSKAYPAYFDHFQDDLISESNKRVFNDALLEDHHALLPLAPAPDGLSEDEKRIYDMVLLSFVQAFWPDEQYVSLKVRIVAGGQDFFAQGKSVTDPGWTTIGEDDEEKPINEDEETVGLPDLVSGDTVALSRVDLAAKETKPPAPFTEASLLAAMEKPGRFLEDKEGAKFESGVGLGTQATRAEVIETLLKREYVLRVKRTLRASEKGFHFFDAVVSSEEMKRFMEVDVTAQWEALLKDRPVAFYEDVESLVRTLVSELKGQDLSAFEQKRDSLGKCPKCGEPVYEGKKKFFCSAWKENGCDFGIWKEFVGASVSAATVTKLLEGKKSGKLKCKSRAGNKFEARVFLGPEHKLELEFENQKAGGKS